MPKKKSPSFWIWTRIEILCSMATNLIRQQYFRLTKIPFSFRMRPKKINENVEYIVYHLMCNCWLKNVTLSKILCNKVFSLLVDCLAGNNFLWKLTFIDASSETMKLMRGISCFALYQGSTSLYGVLLLACVALIDSLWRAP